MPVQISWEVFLNRFFV